MFEYNVQRTNTRNAFEPQWAVDRDGSQCLVGEDDLSCAGQMAVVELNQQFAVATSDSPTLQLPRRHFRQTNL